MRSGSFCPCLRVLALLVASSASSGCYLSHRIPDLDEDAAVPCTPPPREVLTMDVEILSVVPATCSVVGFRFQREIDFGGGPLESGCEGAQLVPSADGCGFHFADHCLGVELDRRFDGNLRGASASGLVTIDERVGYAFAPCRRQEFWSRAP